LVPYSKPVNALIDPSITIVNVMNATEIVGITA
jgi:hypothetical protein